MAGEKKKTKIRKAVIAVAGAGTRFLPATKAQPKEMLPIVDKPIVQYVVEELVESGITDIIFVTRADKKPLEDHFDRLTHLEDALEKSGKHSLKQSVREIAEMANYVYVRQRGQYGTGSPVLSAASMIGDEPFVYAFGDDLVLSETPFTKSLIKKYDETGAPVIGVQSVPAAEISRYGILVADQKTGQVRSIIEKPSKDETSSTLAQFGRMVITPEIVEELRHTPVGKLGELFITDAVARFIARGGKVYAEEVKDGRWLTTGDPLNYLKATLAYALKRDDIGPAFREHLKTLFP